MAIDTTRLFTALGKIISSVNSVNTYRGTTLPARVAVLDAQYVSPNQELITELYPNQAAAQVNGHDEWLAYLQNLAYLTLYQECNLDRPVTDASTGALLSSVIRQMRVLVPETVSEAPSVISTTPVLTVGDAVLVFEASVNPSDLYLPDAYNILVTSDQTTGSTAFSEFLSVIGKANVGDLDWRWPQGSSVNTGISVTDSANDTLVSSDFSAGWIESGTVAATTGNPRTNGTAIPYRLTNNGSYVQYLLPALAPGSYTWTLFAMNDAANDPGDLFVVSIVDGTGSTVATLESVAADASAGSWVQYTGVWNFAVYPPVDPSTYYIRFQVSAAAPCIVDVLMPGFDYAVPLYTGGPVMYCWAGTTPLGLADYWTATVTRAKTETASLYRGLVRLLGLPDYSPYAFFPTAVDGSATFKDALIV